MNGAPAKLPVTVIILSFNEELHIRRCLERITPVVERVVVIDSFSTDRTVEIARELGAEVYQNVWKNYAAQFQWGVDRAAITTEWTMRLDSDEYLEPGLIAEIRDKLPGFPAEITACALRLKVIFRGKFIRWGGYHSTLLTRIWRTDAGQIEQRWMDEHIVISRGQRVRVAGGDLVDENLKDIGWWIDKHNGYTTRQMIDFINLEHPLFPMDQRLQVDTNSHAKWKRFLRNIVFARTPLYLRSVLYFFQRYFLRLGFLDGRRGFLFHFMQGFWNFMLIDAKVDEARLYICQHGIEAFKLHLAARYGIKDLSPVERS